MQQRKLTETLWGRALAWVLLALCVLGLLACAFGVYAAWELQVYTQVDITQLKREHLSDICASAGYEIAVNVIREDPEAAWALARAKNAEFRILNASGQEIWKSADFDALSGSDYRGSYVVQVLESDTGRIYGLARSDEFPETPTPTPEPTPTPMPTSAPALVPPAEPEETQKLDYTVEAVVDPVLPIHDEYYWTALGLEALWALRYWVYVIGGALLALGLACFIFLLCAAGRRAGREELTPGYFTRIPFDLVTAFAAVWCCGVVQLAGEGVNRAHLQFAIPVGCLAVVVLALSFTLWCTSLALRVKLGKWWENTILFRLLKLLWRGVRAFFRGLGALLRGLPLVWKTALGLLAWSAVQFIWMVHFRHNGDTLVFFWLLEKLIVVPAALWVALNLRRLQRGGEALAAGDLSYQTDTRHMFPDFRRHGENLNSVAAGMESAVARQMKSERMKTELITNVSHDIKTPLTSIINYVDLLRSAPDDARRAECMEVLDRQARRLKKLTEDLIEVSKASSGNMEAELSRHSVSELLRQALGEYSDRLTEAGLEAVLTLPETELYAAVDGRLMWRILDNLFSNARKYAQSGTRLYIDAKEAEGLVTLQFKNISRERLNVPAEELMERFVRGDSARTGEGSGLGLSIARSLTELQRGSFDLSVDGDLFKVELRFPAA